MVRLRIASIVSFRFRAILGSSLTEFSSWLDDDTFDDPEKSPKLIERLLFVDFTLCGAEPKPRDIRLLGFFWF